MSYSIAGLTIESMEFTKAWGLSPAGASVTGVGELNQNPVGRDAVLTIDGASFHGEVTHSVTETGDGRRVRLQFADNRIKLQNDDVYCLFNRAEVRADNPATPGIDRQKRYMHVLPENWEKQIKTFTKAPFTAAEIIDKLLSAPTVTHNWSASKIGLQNKAIGEIDCQNGKKLGNALQEVTDAQGLVFTLDDRWTLRWALKGDGQSPAFDRLRTSEWTAGEAVSGVDTKVRVVGDRNVYQDFVTLEADWLPGYQDLWSEPDWLVQVETHFGPFADDHAGRARRAARARTVTVREFAEKKGRTFEDRGMWGEVSRMEIPVWTYLQDIVFKAYRVPRSYTFNGVPLHSLELQEGLIAAVNYTAAGELSYKTPREYYPDTKAFAIVMGQQLGLLDPTKQRVITPAELAAAGTTWSPNNKFNLDVRNNTIIFEDAIYIPGSGANGLFVFPNEQVSGVSDALKAVVVPNAKAKVRPASVKASLVWAAERFHKTFGSGRRKGSYFAQGLSRHVLYNGAARIGEVPYADDKTADEKAREISEAVVARYQTYESGSRLRQGAVGTTLTGVIDRVTISLSFSEGITERIELSKERGQSNFQSERELERKQRTKDLFPGQQDLKQEVEKLETTAKIKELSRKPGTASYRSMTELIEKPIGAVQPSVVKIHSRDQWKAGQPVFLDDTDKPSKDGNRFGGIVIADGATGSMACATQGIVPVRAKGPFKAGDKCGINKGADQVPSKTGKLPIGTFNSDYTGSDIVLVPVRLGSAPPPQKRHPWQPYESPWNGTGAAPPSQKLKFRLAPGMMESFMPSNMLAEFTAAVNAMTFAWLRVDIGSSGNISAVVIQTGQTLPAPPPPPDPNVNAGWPAFISVPLTEVECDSTQIIEMWPLEVTSLSLIRAISAWNGQQYTISLAVARDPISIFL